MAVASKLTAIGILAFSVVIGFLTFYVFSDLTKSQKKKHLEELTSQLINFVIFIWLGKIVWNLPRFISDPIPILAYPSDSKAFYFAVVLSILLFLHKIKRKNVNVLPFLESFSLVFLISSFVYEFIQFSVEENPYAFGYLILLAILIVLFFFLRERITSSNFLMVIVTVWSIGMIILSFIQPFVTVFSYIVLPWFVGLLFVMSNGIIYKLRKRDA